MSFVSNKFVQNCFRKELKKVYSDKGLLTPIEKVASSSKHELSPTADLFVDLVRLGEELRNRGFFIQADALEEKAFLYKKAYNEPTAQPEEQNEVENVSFYNLQFDNVLEFAHGLPDFQGFDSQVEGKRKVKNINETQQDIMKMVQKQPTGLYSVGNHNVVELIKMAQEAPTDQNLKTMIDSILSKLKSPPQIKYENYENLSQGLNEQYNKQLEWLRTTKQKRENLWKLRGYIENFNGTSIDVTTINNAFQTNLTFPPDDTSGKTTSKDKAAGYVKNEIEKLDISIGKVQNDINSDINRLAEVLYPEIEGYKKDILDDITLSNITKNYSTVSTINSAIPEKAKKIFDINEINYNPNLETIKSTIRTSYVNLEKIYNLLQIKSITTIGEILRSVNKANAQELNDLNTGLAQVTPHLLKIIDSSKASEDDKLKAKSLNVKTAKLHLTKRAKVPNVFPTNYQSSKSTPSGGGAGVSGGGAKSQQQAKNQNVVDMQSTIITIRNAIQGKEYTLDAVVSGTNTQAPDGVWGPRTSKALEQLQAIIDKVQLGGQLIIKPSNVDDDAKTNINILSKLKQKLGEIHSDIGGKLGVNYYDKLPKQYVPVQLSEVLDDNSITLNRKNLSSLSALLYSLELEGFKK